MSSAVPHHLPIGHPEYRYPPSKNPYWAKLRRPENSECDSAGSDSESSSKAKSEATPEATIEAKIAKTVFSDNETERHRGHWRSQFKNSTLQTQGPNETNDSERELRELHVEIGCNAGHVVVEWAARNTEKNYIGIDWKFKTIFRGAEKSVKRKLKNLLFFRAHAERISFMFGPQEIDSLYLFFPDPWPRKSQWKNRFVTADRLKEIAPLMKPNGIFHLKTDHPGYFEWMLEAIEQASSHWEVVEMTRDLHKDHPAPETLMIPEVTLFERIFIKEGISIQSVKIRPRAQHH